MSRVGWTAGIAAIVSLVPTPGAGAAPRPRLAGTTTIVAAGPSTRLPVTVPRHIDLPEGYVDPAYLSVSGTSDLVLAYLVPSRPRPLLQAPVMFGRTSATVGGHTVAAFPDGVAEIAAGDYDLVVVHTPGTATVQLRLPGLPGAVVLRPTQRSEAQLARLSAAPLVPVGTSGGVTGTLARTGFVHVGGSVVSDTGGVSRLTVCLSRPEDVVPAPAQFAPGCPGLRTASFLAAQGSRSFGQAMFLNHRPGRYGGGYTYEMVGVATATAGFVAWVPVG